MLLVSLNGSDMNKDEWKNLENERKLRDFDFEKGRVGISQIGDSLGLKNKCEPYQQGILIGILL